MTGDKIKFAVVGCGHIGKRHAEMIVQNHECELTGLIDTKNKSDLEINDFDVPFFSSIDEFLNAGIETEVINIATPNGLHAKHALKALESKKNVIIEKPMALHKLDAEKIIFQALKMKKEVIVVMQNRYSPPSIWLKEIIKSGKLGKIFMVQVNCFWNRDERYYKKGNWHGSNDLDGGSLFTQFSHFIDTISWLFGDIKNITKRFKNYNHQQLTDFEDSGIVSFDLENGGMGSLNFTTSAWNKNLESSLTIIAENGSIKLNGQYMNEVAYCHVKNYELQGLQKKIICETSNVNLQQNNHHYVIASMVDVLKGRTENKTNAAEGLKVVDIIERIYNS